MLGNMEKSVSSVVGNSGSEDGKVSRGKGGRTRGRGRRKKEGDEAWGATKRQKRTQANKDIEEIDIPNNDPTQVDIPEREKGDLNPDAVKLYRITFHEVIWPTLVHQYGWRLEAGNRPNDSYFVPKGVERGRKGYKNRLDFFDSSKQVIEKLLSEECIYEKTLDDAWRASHVKRAMKILADRDKKKSQNSIRSSRGRKSSLSGWAHFTSLKHTRVGDQFQVDPAMLSEWPSSSSLSAAPPLLKHPSDDETDLLYTAVWQPSTEDNQADLSIYLKDNADKLSEDQLLIALEVHGRNFQKASEAVAKFAAAHGKTGVDGILLEPWGEEEAMEYSNLMVMHLKHFGKVANSMPSRTLGEVMHRYYAYWKKHRPSPVSEKGEIAEAQAGERRPLNVAANPDGIATAAVVTEEVAAFDNTEHDAFTMEEGKAEGDMVERRLQFDDSRLSTMTTTYVPQSESEVKGEEVNTTISHTGALVTEVTKRPQSDDALPSSRLDEKIGVLKKNENSASAASQGTYHPLEDPPSLPYPTSPFDSHFVIMPDEEFLAHKAAHTKATATEESAAAVAASPKKPPRILVSPSAEDGAKGGATTTSPSVPPVLFFVKESEARCYTQQYLDLKIAVREDRILKEQAEMQNILNDDFCYKCQIDSILDLLCCDGCPRTYHLTCVDLKEVPEGDWMCDICLGLRDSEEEPIGVRKLVKCVPNQSEPVGLVQPPPAVPTRRGPNRSARRNGAYSEEPDGGMLLELALNPPLQLSPESVRSSRPVVASMPSKDGDVARKGKAAALPEVVLGLPPSSSTLSSGPRYQDQVV